MFRKVLFGKVFIGNSSVRYPIPVLTIQSRQGVLTIPCTTFHNMQVPKLKSTWDMIMERGLAKNIMLMPGRIGEKLGSCQVEKGKGHAQAS
jgi:hypothetical protein